MKLWKIIAAVLVVSCCVVHRRVIQSLITGSPMPKAPKWHFWVPEDKRRDA